MMKQVDMEMINRFVAGSCDDDREELWLDEIVSEEEYEFEGESAAGRSGYAGGRPAGN